MKKTTQQGFGHLGLALFLVAAGIIAFVGYQVVKTNSAVAPPTTSSTIPATINSAPAIKNAADLNAAENTLNNTNIDQGLDPHSYSQDVNSLL